MLKDRVCQQLDRLRKESDDEELAEDKAKLNLWLSEIEDTIRVGLGDDSALAESARGFRGKSQAQEGSNETTIASATELIDRAKRACRLATVANGRDDLPEYVRVLVNDKYVHSQWFYAQVVMLLAMVGLAFAGTFRIYGQTVDFGKAARESRGELKDEVIQFKTSARERLDALDKFKIEAIDATNELRKINDTMNATVAKAGKRAKKALDGELDDFVERKESAMKQLEEIDRTVGKRIKDAVKTEVVIAAVDSKLAAVDEEVESLQFHILNGEERVACFIEDLEATEFMVQRVSQEAPAIFVRLGPIGKLDDRLQRVEQSAGFRWWDSVIGLTALSGLALALAMWMYRRQGK